jgi:hypothetical protein
MLKAFESFDFDSAVKVHNLLYDDEPTTVDQMKEDLQESLESLYEDAKKMYRTPSEDKDITGILWEAGHDLGMDSDGIYIRIWSSGIVELSYRVCWTHSDFTSK